MEDSIIEILQDLTDEAPSFNSNPDQLKAAVSNLLQSGGVGYSQMNELLLTLGYDRISEDFFQFLVEGADQYTPGSAITSLEQLRKYVNEFRKLAALRYGNIKYAFRHISQLTDFDLANELSLIEPIDEDSYKIRHDPLIPIKPIPGNETYFLGYIVERELNKRLQENPNDDEAKKMLARRTEIVKTGKDNHESYLASDHMDIYVATSMRERHEYQTINKVISQVFSDTKLQSLKLRFFDPTQAYCNDRIDKGLAEGLMLKRATCTLYLAQESDTLGKDSELASTLAQGKPVIAYIPKIEEGQEQQFVNDLLNMLKEGKHGVSEKELALGQLQVFSPHLAWGDKTIIKWLADPEAADLNQIKEKLGIVIRNHYDKRADILKKTHPLGIQVHLETGVANGVLVARSPQQCSELIYRVMTKRLEFELNTKKINNNTYLELIETTTHSVFRVVTGDHFLTNAFWNFYLLRR